MNTPEKIVKDQYKTSSVNRLTSNAEFNKDAETMYRLKEEFMQAHENVREKGVGLMKWRQKWAGECFEQAKGMSERLKAKTWGIWEDVSVIEKNPNAFLEKVWLRCESGKPFKGIYNRNGWFEDEGGLSVSPIQYSLIYK